MATTTNTDYNGWKNRSTWNVALWINNDYSLYQSAVNYKNRREKEGKKITYSGFIRSLGMQYDKTPDNIKWISKLLDYSALNEMMMEL
jgi:hypothetical protein